MTSADDLYRDYIEEKHSRGRHRAEDTSTGFVLWVIAFACCGALLWAALAVVAIILFA